MSSGVDVGFSLKKVSAREVMEFTKGLKNNPDDSVELFANLLAKTVVSAPIEGDLTDPNTYMDMPFWTDPDSDDLTFNDMVHGLNEVLEKAQSSTRKQ